jgi:hypothetical protein
MDEQASTYFIYHPRSKAAECKRLTLQDQFITAAMGVSSRSKHTPLSFNTCSISAVVLVVGSCKRQSSIQRCAWLG